MVEDIDAVPRGLAATTVVMHELLATPTSHLATRCAGPCRHGARLSQRVVAKTEYRRRPGQTTAGQSH
jgi:hypothetical protein